MVTKSDQRPDGVLCAGGYRFTPDDCRGGAAATLAFFHLRKSGGGPFDEWLLRKHIHPRSSGTHVNGGVDGWWDGWRDGLDVREVNNLMPIDLLSV